MFADLNVFRLASAMAVHAGARQAVIAQNVANADTPGYAARDIRPFDEMVGQRDGVGQTMLATRPRHLNGTASTHVDIRDIPRTGDRDPNENNVSIEEEMLHAVSVKRQHDRAIAIYRSSLNILRMTLGRQ